MKIGIIGLGLMGGSFGRTLIRRGFTVYGYDVNTDAMLKAELMRAFTAPLTEENAKTVDLLVSAVKPSLFKDATEKFLPLLKSGAIISDFCGVKRETVKVMREWAKVYPELSFIGGHPMAGREFSGIEHSSVILFEKASMILVPVKADIFAVDRIKEFYLSVGFSKAVITDEDTHDKIIAYTSQLCHIVSNAFIKNKRAENRAGYSAGSFRDLTRVARMDPEMWAELIFLNRDNALLELDELMDNLNKYRAAIAEGDKDKLRALFSEGNERKIKIEQGKENDV
ncbi:MAG: prephenate dehydrogenase/arogenate dehydrogenase family protein [Christensenellaceae bacterium]